MTAWGVDTNEEVRRVWRVAPGAEGSTAEGHTVRLPRTGVVASPRHIGHRISDGRPLRIHTGTAVEQVNGSFNAMDDRYREWANDLLPFGSDVSTPGIRYLASSYQANKIVLLDTDNFTNAVATTIFQQSVLGAADITSAADFAASAYAGRTAAAPTRALNWVTTEGVRVVLASLVDYGALANEPPFTRPTSMRS